MKGHFLLSPFKFLMRRRIDIGSVTCKNSVRPSLNSQKSKWQAGEAADTTKYSDSELSKPLIEVFALNLIW